MRAVSSCSASDSRRVVRRATLSPRMKAPWRTAQRHGCSSAAGWLNTADGSRTPTVPWWTTTNPTASRNGDHDWYSETTATMTKKWKCDSPLPSARWTTIADDVIKPRVALAMRRGRPRRRNVATAASMARGMPSTSACPRALPWRRPKATTVATCSHRSATRPACRRCQASSGRWVPRGTRRFTASTPMLPVMQGERPPVNSMIGSFRPGGAAAGTMG